MDTSKYHIDFIDIGLRVKALRETRGWSQEKLAAEANISQPTLTRLENGSTNLELATIIKVANALETSMDELLCASLICGTKVYQQEYTELVKNCSVLEMRLINNVVSDLLKSFRAACEQHNI